MANSPVFAATPKSFQATLTGAPGAGYRAGSDQTSFVEIVAGGASGSRVERVILKHAGVAGNAPTAALTVLFFLYDGSTYKLLAEVDVGAVATPAAGTASYQATVPLLEGKLLPSTSHKIFGVIAGWVDADDDFTVCGDAGDY